MKKYIKPISELIEAETSLPLMMSLNDEIGDGQLANTFEFEEDDDNDYLYRAPKDNLEIGF